MKTSELVDTDRIQPRVKLAWITTFFNLNGMGPDLLSEICNKICSRLNWRFSLLWLITNHIKIFINSLKMSDFIYAFLILVTLKLADFAVAEKVT